MIQYGRQNISAEDIRAVNEVLSSSYLTQGPVVREFEAALASYVGCSKAVFLATSSLNLGSRKREIIWYPTHGH